MLILNGVYIHSCMVFYEHFNVEDILCNKEAFANFAEHNLAWNPMYKRCVEVFREAARSEAIDCPSENGFWRGAPPEIRDADTIRKIQNLLTECYAFCKSNSSGDASWANTYIMTAAAFILADKPFMPPSSSRKEISGSEKILFSQDKLELAPRKYRCVYDPSFVMCKDHKIQTICVMKNLDYDGVCSIDLNQKDQTVDSLEIGDRDILFFNVVENTVVSVFNNANAKNGTPIPPEAVSFTVLNGNEYVYIQDGRVRTLGLNTLTPDPLVLMSHRFVETDSRKGTLYLLSETGLVIEVIPGCTQYKTGKYASLQQYFGMQKGGERK